MVNLNQLNTPHLDRQTFHLCDRFSLFVVESLIVIVSNDNPIQIPLSPLSPLYHRATWPLTLVFY